MYNLSGLMNIFQRFAQISKILIKRIYKSHTYIVLPQTPIKENMTFWCKKSNKNISTSNSCHFDTFLNVVKGYSTALEKFPKLSEPMAIHKITYSTIQFWKSTHPQKVQYSSGLWNKIWSKLYYFKSLCSGADVMWCKTHWHSTIFCKMIMVLR